MPDISIAISARDNYSTVLRTMSDSTRAFDKDAQGLQQRLDALDKTKASLKLDVRDAQKALKDAQKEYDELAKSANKSADQQTEAAKKVEKASQNYENAKRNMSAVSKEAGQTQKSIENLNKEVSKATNKAQGGSSGNIGQGGIAAGTTRALGMAAAAKLLGNTGVAAAKYFVGSAYGSSMSSIFENMLSGAASGASVGTLIGGPGTGTAAGAIAGVGLGLVNAGIQKAQKKDDLYRAKVSEEYDSATQARDNALTTGSSTAAQREMDMISFSTLLGGNDQATSLLSQVKEMANETPYFYDNLTGIAKQLSVYGYDAQGIMSQIKNIGNAGAAIGWSPADMETIAQQIGFLKESDSVSTMQLKQLLRKGLPVYDWLETALNKTKSQIDDMVSGGELNGENAAQIISDKMSKAYAGSMIKQSETYTGKLSTVQGLQGEVYNAEGDAYNAARLNGSGSLSEQADWLSGANGTKMQGIYSKYGAFKGEEENKLNLMIMQEQAAAMNKSGFEKMNVTDQMNALSAAEMDARNKYMETDGAKQLQTSETNLINSLQQSASVNQACFMAGKEIQNQLSKGLQAQNLEFDVIAHVSTSGSQRFGGVGEKSATDNTKGNWFDSAINTIDHYLNDKPGTGVYAKGKKKSAYGVAYVPRDDVQYTLHQGERVLTASENRAYGKGTSGVVITGNNFTVREEDDIDKIADKLFRKIQIAKMTAVG